MTHYNDVMNLDGGAKSKE
jgi:hypothetical protein